MTFDDKDSGDARPLRVKGEATGTRNPFVTVADRLVVGDYEVLLDLSEFEVEEGYALTQCVNSLRELLIRGAKIAITGAPPIFTAGITRAGLLLPPTALRIETRAATA